jgi:hypothetical protein
VSFFTVVSIFERIFLENRFTRFFPVGFRFIRYRSAAHVLSSSYILSCWLLNDNQLL